MTAPRVHPIARDLVAWFRAEGLDLPWRRTIDPWYILVSEFMLQQTTISTVLGRYEAWMAQFPTPRHLAEVSEQEALRSWEGLGYYRRVRSLQRIARELVAHHGGVMPREAAQIKALPGIGDYTLGALLSFAYNISAPLVDANVSRVLARVTDDPTPIDSNEGKKKHWALAAELVHPSNARAYNSAIMELGQRICTLRSPSCLICPIRTHCRATEPEQLPVKLEKKAVTALVHHDLFCLHPQQGLLLVRQSEGARHEGMYRLPSRELSEVEHLPQIITQRYSVTRYKVTRHLYRISSNELTLREGETFIPLSQLASIPMASPDRKIINKHLSDSV